MLIICQNNRTAHFTELKVLKSAHKLYISVYKFCAWKRLTIVFMLIIVLCIMNSDEVLTSL